LIHTANARDTAKKAAPMILITATVFFMPHQENVCEVAKGNATTTLKAFIHDSFSHLIAIIRIFQ